MNLPTILFAASICGALPDLPKDRKDGVTVESESKKLQGTWVFESGDFNGVAMPDNFKGSKLLIQKNEMRWSVTMGNPNKGIAFTIRPEKSPKQLDLQLGDKVEQGIYKLEGDSFVWASRSPGKERPKELASAANSEIKVFRFKREKAER